MIFSTVSVALQLSLLSMLANVFLFTFLAGLRQSPAVLFAKSFFFDFSVCENVFFTFSSAGTETQTAWNKYGSVQELRSTFGHLKSFKILVRHTGRHSTP